MSLIDGAVILLYFFGMLAVGWYYSRQVQSADDFLLGGRSMSPWMIGLSLFATITSTLSYLAFPGEMIKHGPMVFSEFASFPLIYLIVGYVLIPQIMRQRVTSGYELLEKRLGLLGRLLGSGMFVTLRLVWMATILYATTSKVLLPLMGIKEEWFIPIAALLGALTLVYTVQGGLKAVVVTDAAQALLMFTGAIGIVLVVTYQLGSVSAWWPQAWVEHWQKPAFWPHPLIRITFIGANLNFLVWLVCTAGSDQMAIQRYLATRDAAAARKSFFIQLCSSTINASLLAIAGIALLGFYLARPAALPANLNLQENADKLMPQFIMTQMPPGLSGLVIAAVLSAAMSSLSSGLNSASAVIVTDFIGRLFGGEPEPRQEVARVRSVSIGIGSVAVLLSLTVGSLAGNLLELCMKVVNLLTAPLFTLFFLALFVRWATPLGALAATIAGVSVAVEIAFAKQFTDLSFLWMSPLSLLVGIVVGMAVSALPYTRIPVTPKSTELLPKSTPS